MRKWIPSLLLLTFLMALLPSLAQAQDRRDEGPPVVVEITPPDPVMPEIIGPVVLVCGGELVQVTGPQIVFVRVSSNPGPPDITRPVVEHPPDPVAPPDPVVPPNPC